MSLQLAVISALADRAEGKDFSGVLDDTRRSLAEKYLRDSCSVEDVTYLLGFSEPSAFNTWARGSSHSCA